MTQTKLPKNFNPYRVKDDSVFMVTNAKKTPVRIELENAWWFNVGYCVRCNHERLHTHVEVGLKPSLPAAPCENCGSKTVYGAIKWHQWFNAVYDQKI